MAAKNQLSGRTKSPVTTRWPSTPTHSVPSTRGTSPSRCTVYTRSYLKADYLGKYVSEPSQFQASLSAVRQVHFEVTTGKTILRSVQDYHIEFTQVLSTWDATQQLPLDPVQTFWAGLHEDIREHARSSDYHPPAAPVGAVDSYQAMLTRLREAKDKAETFARSLRATSKFIDKRMGRGGTRRNAPQAFHAEPERQAAPGRSVFQPMPFAAPVMAAAAATRTIYDVETAAYEETDDYVRPIIRRRSLVCPGPIRYVTARGPVQFPQRHIAAHARLR